MEEKEKMWRNTETDDKKDAKKRKRTVTILGRNSIARAHSYLLNL